MQHDVDFIRRFTSVRARFLHRLDSWLSGFRDLRTQLEPAAQGIGGSHGYLVDTSRRLTGSVLPAGSVAELRGRAHKIAGTALTFGFPEFSALARDLEDKLTTTTGTVNDDALCLSLDRFILAAEEIGRDGAAGEDAEDGPGTLLLAREKVAAAVSAGRRGRPVHLMVVDDDEFVRDLLRAGLGGLGWRITQAESGLDALLKLLQCSGAARAQRPDIMLLDINMPDMDGFTSLERIRASPLWHHLPVIMLTRRHEDSSRIRCLGEGVDDYLLKPFEISTVARRISNVLAARSRSVLIGCSQSERGAALARLLKESGKRVRLVHTSEEAWAALSAEAPLLALLDANLSGEGGLELLRRARDRVETAAIPILIGAHEEDREFRVQCLDAGADDCIPLISPIDYVSSRILGCLHS